MTLIQDYGAAPGVLLIGAPRDREILAEAAAAADVRVSGAIDWTDLAGSADAPVLLAVAAAGDLSPEALPDLLAPLTKLADRLDGGVVVTVRLDQVDPVTAALVGTRAELLCDPDGATLALTLALAATRRGIRLADSVREGEAERFRRLNEEVARVAAVLTRLTREQESTAFAAVADRTRHYEGPPATNPHISATQIRRVIRARRLRDAHFSGGMFEDPAWDMLLDLYAASLEGAQVSVSSLCIAAAVAPTTALRWIVRMTDAGLFDRQADPFDRRRAYLELSGLAREKMDRYFAALAQNGLSIA